MEEENSEPVCLVCGERKVFTTCTGCSRTICESCSRFELVGSGCGTVWPVYYCPACAQDPDINPNAVLREPEKRDL